MDRTPHPPPNPSTRHRQQIAAATLANLLTLPAPEVSSWDLSASTRTPPVSGMLLADCLGQARIALLQWAAVLDDAALKCRTHQHCRHHLSVTGTFHGTGIEIWVLLDIGDADPVELLASPGLDAPAERAECLECETSGRNCLAHRDLAGVGV